MSLEPNPDRATEGRVIDADGVAPEDLPTPPEVEVTPAAVMAYWFDLIDEDTAAGFYGLKDRALQKWRQTGEGPRYYALSSRCLRYTRFDLRSHAMARVRTSTADPGPEEAAA